MNEEIRETLTEHFSTFDCSKTLIDILKKNSIEEDIQIERKYLSTNFYEEQSIPNSLCELKLYSACISLEYLSNTMIVNKNGKNKRSSIIDEVQEAASQINTLFFKIHLLNLCGNYDIQFQSLNILSPSEFFLMISRIYPMISGLIIFLFVLMIFSIINIIF
jgi:hypothetical protein